MTRLAIHDLQLAAGNRGGDYESAGFDPVGNDRVVGAAESRNAGDGDRRRAGAFDFRAHFGEQLGEVYYLRLAGGVRDSRHAVGQDGGHHHVLRPGDGDGFRLDVGAAQPRGAGFDHAAAQFDLRAHFFQRHQVQVYGALADGAAPGQADARLTKSPQERPQRQHRRPHGFDQFIRRLVIFDRAGVDLMGAQFRDEHGATQVFEQSPHRDQVAHVRHVAQRHRFGSEQRRGQTRQGRILRAADYDAAFQLFSADDSKFIHAFYMRSNCHSEAIREEMSVANPPMYSKRQIIDSP